MTQGDSIDRIVSDAAASVEMEGYHVDEECKEWCRKLLSSEITLEQYLDFAKKKAGVAVS